MFNQGSFLQRKPACPLLVVGADEGRIDRKLNINILQSEAQTLYSFNSLRKKYAIEYSLKTG